jgi:hypothetical protein
MRKVFRARLPANPANPIGGTQLIQQPFRCHSLAVSFPVLWKSFVRVGVPVLTVLHAKRNKGLQAFDDAGLILSAHKTENST